MYGAGGLGEREKREREKEAVGKIKLFAEALLVRISGNYLGWRMDETLKRVILDLDTPPNHYILPT